MNLGSGKEAGAGGCAPRESADQCPETETIRSRDTNSPTPLSPSQGSAQGLIAKAYAETALRTRGLHDIDEVAKEWKSLVDALDLYRKEAFNLYNFHAAEPVCQGSASDEGLASRFSKEDAELAQKIANDIHEDIDCNETKKQLRMAVSYWSCVASDEANNRIANDTRKLITTLEESLRRKSLAPDKEVLTALDQAQADLQLHAISFHVNPQHGNYFLCKICNAESKDSNRAVQHSESCSFLAISKARAALAAAPKEAKE